MAWEIPECRNFHWKEKSWACSPGDSRIQLGALLLATEGIAVELDVPGAMAVRGHQPLCIPGGGVLGSMVPGADLILGWILLRI